MQIQTKTQLHVVVEARTESGEFMASVEVVLDERVQFEAEQVLDQLVVAAKAKAKE